MEAALGLEQLQVALENGSTYYRTLDILATPLPSFFTLSTLSPPFFHPSNTSSPLFYLIWLDSPQVVLEARNNASFINMLEPLHKILYSSPPINRALGRIVPELGHSPFVRALVRRLRHPNALARKRVLSILTLIYERHQAPKQLVEKHELEPVLRAIKLSDPGVLVQQMASQLHRSFEAHDVL